jgi:hypothetical protein
MAALSALSFGSFLILVNSARKPLLEFDFSVKMFVRVASP